MKLSWGLRIVILYGVFILIIMSMVAYFMTRDVDLITPKYYDNEIKYQDKIDMMERTKNLPEKVKIILSDSYLTIQFPKSMEQNMISGQAVFYRPSELKGDIRVPLKLNNDHQQVINISRFEKGLWKLQLNWKLKDVGFYNEETINLQ